LWEADKSLEARSVYGTVDPTHPAVAYLDSGTGNSTTITCVAALWHIAHRASGR
jgi:ATP sulfurylase